MWRIGFGTRILTSKSFQGPNCYRTVLPDKEAVIIQFGRELFGRHYVSGDTYAHALQLFGERDLVDFVNLMALHADDATMLTAFDQRLPAGEKPLLPTP